MTTYLLISAHHDYRTARRSSIHFIADELAKRGEVRFFSMRYSRLSRHKGDIRHALDGCANQVQTHQGVQCFLWKTPLHPINLHKAVVAPAGKPFVWHLPQHALSDFEKVGRPGRCHRLRKRHCPDLL